jgi:Na+-driven multidrug efflux pump
MGAVVGVVEICLAPFFPYLYNTEAAVREMATGIMITYAFFIPSLSFALACYYTIRSGGKVFVTFLFDCGYAWCIVTPVAFAVTYLTSLPVIPIYAITLFAEATKCIVGFIIVKRGRWLKQLS